MASALLPKDLIVGIPIYKNRLTANEKLSLEQGVKILGKYAITFIAPPDIDKAYYRQFGEQITFTIFSKEYFKDTKSYSALLTAPKFYKAFLGHQFLLIYQTDAYVFRDDLLLWANKNYDYIGAPWIEKPTTLVKPWVDLNKYSVGKVGNGGFSLRKIRSHYDMSKRWGWIQFFFRKNEDYFWSIIVPFLNRNFSIPELKNAIDFAFELAPEKSYKMNGDQLPFGCHAWEKYNPEFWSAFIPLKKEKAD